MIDIRIMCAHAGDMKQILNLVVLLVSLNASKIDQKPSPMKSKEVKLIGSFSKAKPCERREALFLPIERQLPSHWHLDKGY